MTVRGRFQSAGVKVSSAGATVAASASELARFSRTELPAAGRKSSVTVKVAAPPSASRNAVGSTVAVGSSSSSTATARGAGAQKAESPATV